MGTVSSAANPRPTAVFTVLETARYEHMPRKYAKIMFSTKCP